MANEMTTPKRLALLAVCAAMLVALTGCSKRAPVREALTAMRATTLEQGRITRRVVHSLVASYFGEVEARLRARAELRRAELREEIHRRAQAKVYDVSAIAIAQLEAALEGPVARLDAALREEQAKPIHARARARELEIAVQLSTTLAALARESDRLTQQIATRTALARERALALIDAQMAEVLSAPQIDLDPDVLAREVLDEFERESTRYDGRMLGGLAQLERHIDGSRNALREFTKGLFGDRLGEQVARRAAELIGRGEAFIGDELRELRDAAIQRLEASA